MIYLVIEDFYPEAGYNLIGYSTNLDTAKICLDKFVKTPGAPGGTEIAIVDSIPETIYRN